MSENMELEERVRALEQEIKRLEKVNEALMNRVERSTDAAGSAYSLFESNLLLQNKVKEHTGKLVEINHALQREIGERKRTEEALRWERNFVNAVLDAAGALIVVLDREGRIVRFNRACERISGYSFEEVRSKPLWELLLVPEEVEEVEKRFERLLAGEFPNEGENHWVTKSGERRLISWSNTTLNDAEGEIEYIVGIGIDITEAREAEEGLRLYRRIFMSTSDAVIVHDPEGKIIAKNPVYERISGHSDEGVIDAHIDTMIDEDVHNQIEQSMKERGSFREEVKVQAKDGSVYFFDLSEFRITNDAGDLTFSVAIARDITERKKDQEALATRLRYEVNLAGCSQALLETGNEEDVLPKALRHLLNGTEADRVYIFENFDDPVDGLCMRQRWEVCAPGVKADMDNPLLQHLPYKDSFGPWRQVLADNRPFGGRTRDLPPEVQEILREGGVLSLLVLPIWANERWYGFIGFDEVDQEREWDEEEVRLLRTAAEMLGGYLARRRAAEALRSSLKDLEQANRDLRETQAQVVQSQKMASLGTLVAGIAHEINTPIGSVSSMHDTLMRAIGKLNDILEAECPEDSPNHRKIQSMMKLIGEANRVIRSGTGRVTTIVRRLRSFARLDEAELKEADIHEGLEDTLTLIHHEIKHNIEVHRNYGDIPRIPCYMARLNQVFVNLLINAKQAIKDKGEITITTYQRDGNVYIEFADAGVGIPKDKLKQIFDPGYTTKNVGVGTGLGLSICYQIMQDHHGEIRVESEVGKGTTFTLVIPTNLDEILGVS